MVPFPDLSARLVRFGPWPGRVRRLAALACLLLAAASAVTSRPDSSATRAPAARPGRSGNPIAARLQPGQVAAPVLLGVGASGFLRSGDRVDLYATADGTALGAARCGQQTGPIGAGLRVLDARTSPATGGGDGSPARVVLAVDAGTAARIATLQGCGMLAVLDKSP